MNLKGRFDLGNIRTIEERANYDNALRSGVPSSQLEPPGQECQLEVEGRTPRAFAPPIIDKLTSKDTPILLDPALSGQIGEIEFNRELLLKGDQRGMSGGVSGGVALRSYPYDKCTPVDSSYLRRVRYRIAIRESQIVKERKQENGQDIHCIREDIIDSRLPVQNPRTPQQGIRQSLQDIRQSQDPCTPFGTSSQDHRLQQQCNVSAMPPSQSGISDELVNGQCMPSYEEAVQSPVLIHVHKDALKMAAGEFIFLYSYGLRSFTARLTHHFTYLQPIFTTHLNYHITPHFTPNLSPHLAPHLASHSLS